MMHVAHTDCPANAGWYYYYWHRLCNIIKRIIRGLILFQFRILAQNARKYLVGPGLLEIGLFVKNSFMKPDLAHGSMET